MLLQPASCLLVLLLLNSVDSVRVLRKIKEYVREQQLEDSKQHANILRTRWPAIKIEKGNILQPLDHFNRQSNETLPQRFFVNDAFWKPPHGPVFLYIGGEGRISEFSVMTGHHVDMAEGHGALLVALEHRFYGDSINPDGLETKNLAALSSQQALADLVAFHQYISQRFGLSPKNTWISFGGSYPGALSAWFRGKFPHLVYAAVASSAPVRAMLDFSAYNKVVGLSLKDAAVGGSDECWDNLRNGFAALEEGLTGGEANVTRVAEDFACCQIPVELDDRMVLMQNLADYVMGTVQYNEEVSSMSVKKLCDIMTGRSSGENGEETGYSRLVKLMQEYRSQAKEPCFDTSYEQMLKELRDTSLSSTQTGMRQWFYQTCTEFGYYQTCEDAMCPFSRKLSLKTQTKLCSLLFDIPAPSVLSSITFTNQYYGARYPHTHRVLYVNGGIDPWHALSVLPNVTADEGRNQAIFIQDTAHCADMMSSRATDRSSLKQARREIGVHVAKWLKNSGWEPTSDSRDLTRSEHNNGTIIWHS